MKNTKMYSLTELRHRHEQLLNETDFCSKRELIEVNRELLYRTRKTCKHHWGHFKTLMGKTRQTPKQEFKCSICGVHGFMQYNDVYHEVGIKAKYIR